MPGTFNLTGDYAIHQGDTYSMDMVLKDENDTPVDITNYEFKSQLRRIHAETNVEAEFVITKIAPYTNGRINLALTPTVTEGMTAVVGVWDIEYDDTAKVVTFIEGTYELNLEVTRDE